MWSIKALILVVHFVLHLSPVEEVKLRQLAWFCYLEDVLLFNQKASSGPLKAP